jgi:hypothetical protein
MAGFKDRHFVVPSLTAVQVIADSVTSAGKMPMGDIFRVQSRDWGDIVWLGSEGLQDAFLAELRRKGIVYRDATPDEIRAFKALG